jgi:hypothetical protein
MMLLQAIVQALDARKNRVLLVAEAALPESQYRAFRKFFLGELGRDGLEQDLARLVAEQDKGRKR